MSPLPFRSRWFTAAALLVLGCARPDYYRPPPISGLRFYAQADLNRAAGDTLRVRLSARNREYLAPGDSADIAAFAVPLRIVLGDSLSPGRYRILTRARGNAWKAGYFNAGEANSVHRPPNVRWSRQAICGLRGLRPYFIGFACSSTSGVSRT